MQTYICGYCPFNFKYKYIVLHDWTNTNRIIKNRWVIWYYVHICLKSIGSRHIRVHKSFCFSLLHFHNKKHNFVCPISGLRVECWEHIKRYTKIDSSSKEINKQYRYKTFIIKLSFKSIFIWWKWTTLLLWVFILNVILWRYFDYVSLLWGRLKS